MTKKNIIFVLDNRAAIIFIVLMLSLLGVYSLVTLPQSVFPKVSFPQITVLVNRGFAPLREMELVVVKPLEDGLHSIAGISSISSKMYQGSAEVNLTFSWKTDLRQAYQSVLAKIAEIKAQLPANTRIQIIPMTTSAFPVAGFSLYSDLSSFLSLKRYTLENIKPRLEKLMGVERVELVGGTNPEYKIMLQPEKLLQYHLNPLKVIEAVKRSNSIDFLGTITEESTLLLGVSDPRLKGLTSLETVVVGKLLDNPVYLKQIAEIVEGTTAMFISTSTNGHPAVLFNITKQQDADVVTVLQSVNVALTEIKGKLPADMHIVKWYDLSEFVQKSIHGVVSNLLTGMMIISLVVFLFLKQIRSSLALIFFMPLTLLITLPGLKIMGLGINIMTLGGLTAAVGILVDNGSVVIENISRYTRKGQNRRNAIINGTKEVVTPLFVSTLTTIAVFIPLTMLDGVAGFFFASSSITIAISLILSFLLAILFMPVMIYSFTGINSTAICHSSENGVLQRTYNTILKRILKRSGSIVLISVCMAGAAIAVFTKLPSDFLPVWDEGTFIMDLDSAPGTSLEKMSRIVDGVEKVIQSIPEITTFSRQTGDEAVRPNEAHFFMHPQPVNGQRSISVFDVMDKLETELIRVYPDLNVDLHQILPDRFLDFSGKQNAIILELSGNHQGDLLPAFSAIKSALDDLSFVEKIKAKIPDTSPGFILKFHNDQLSRTGLSRQDVVSQIQTAIVGSVATTIPNGVERINVRVSYSKKYKNSLEKLPFLPIFTSDGKYIPLSSVATVIVKDMERIGYHLDGLPIIMIDLETQPGNLNEQVTTIQETLSRLKLADGIHVAIGGDWRSQQDSFRQLLFILCLSSVLVFALLLIEFKKITIALIIFSTTILSLSCVVFGLFITHSSFNVSSFIGLITSLGIVVNNGILVMDFVERYRKNGLSVRESLLGAGAVRIRPIMITSITTIGGFLPMAFLFGDGGEMLQPFAVAVISGMTGSVFFSLVVMPSMYSFIFSNRQNTSIKG